MRKTMKRVTSSLLALVMLVGSMTSGANLFPMDVLAEEEQTEYGYFSVSEGNYAQLPVAGVTYLGSESAPIVDYDNGGKKFKTNVNTTYNNGNVGGEIKLLDDTSTYTGEGASAVWTGGTEFAYGLGVHPCNGREGYTDIDLTGLNVDTFYSAVAVTNSKTMNSVSFGVYGKANEKDEWHLLLDFQTVKKGTAGEIKLNISAYSYLRLSVKQVEAYASLSSAWANACVYDSTSVTICDHELTHVKGKEAAPGENGLLEYWYCEECNRYFADEKGKTELTVSELILNRNYFVSEEGDYYGNDAILHYLSDLPDEKLSSYVTPASGSTVGRVVAKDTNFSGNTIKLGEKQQAFEKGLSGVPSMPNKNQNYIWVDISDQDVNRFYAVVGITGSAATSSNGNYGKYGVIFNVYGSTEQTDSTDMKDYELLQSSGAVLRRESGEFDVEIVGYKTLLLVVECSSTANYGCDFSWANACVYNTEEVHNHTLTEVPEKAATMAAEGNIQYWICAGCGKWFYDEEGTNEITDKASVVISRLSAQATANYIPSTDGAFALMPSDVTYLSDLKPASYVTPGNNGVPRTAKLDTNWQGKKIALGKAQSTFTKGLGVLPSASGKANNYIRADISKQSANRFYAAVGITGSASTSTHSNYGKYGVVFWVYGSSEVIESVNPTDYTLLACSGNIYCRESGQFNVDIAGMKTLLLVVETTNQYNYGCDSAWGNVCVYNGTGELTMPITNPQATANFIPNTDGIFAKMPTNATYISNMNPASFVTPGSDGVARTAKMDTTFSGKTIVFGQMQSTFTKGLGILPSVSTKASNYVRADISSLNVNRFYAAVGITGSAATPGHANFEKYGVVFYVYGSTKKTTSTSVADYKLLACSGKVYGRTSGQFNVDIAGIKTLLLVIESSNKYNYGCEAAWGHACVYTGTGELTYSYDASAYRANNGTSRGINPRTGSVVFLSDLKYTEAKNNGSDKKATTLDHPYGTTSGKITLGKNDNRYYKGLGAHPSGYTIYDISTQGRNTFYASVGITNTKGKEGASAGVIFKVYGDYGDGIYQLLSQSQVITRKMTGEFYVNIQGVKKLRLAVEPNGKVDSSGSGWGAACLYNADSRVPYSIDLTEMPPVVKYEESSDGFHVVEKGFTKINKSAVWLSDMPYTSYVTPGNDGVDRRAKRDLDFSNKQIVLGVTETRFDKGFGVLPSVESKDDCYVLVDISGQEGYRFYSAVGMTGTAAKLGHTNYGKYGVIFNVYGSKEQLTTTDLRQYTLLGTSGQLYEETMGEFDLDVTGYQTLLLIADTAGDLNYGCASVWGNACLYTPTGLIAQSRDKYFQKDAYISNVDGFQGIPEDMKDTIIYLSDMVYMQSSNLVTGEYPQGEPTTLDGVYGGTSGSGFVLSEKNTKFEKGLGMMGKARNTPIEGSVESYTIYDISSINCTTFYAAVGLTNEQARNSAEVIFRLYGDYKGRGQYRFLAESETLSGDKTGEFKVDTTGVKVLKLVAISTGENNAGSESAWADACVYGRVSTETMRAGFNLYYLLIPAGALAIAAAVAVPLVIKKKSKAKKNDVILEE